MSDKCKARRFFVPDLQNAAGQLVELPAGEAHHARNVLRVGVGEVVELFDGNGAVAAGTVGDVAKRAVKIEIKDISRSARPRPIVHLAFAVPKGKRLDWLLEKATELGAASLQPVRFERSVSTGELSDAKKQRWQGHCIAAAKQCGINFLPQIRPSISFEEVLNSSDKLFSMLGDAGENAIPIAQALANVEESEILLLIGPEGGLTQAELGEGVSAGLVAVRLGSTTLRVETAAIALLAAAMALCK